MKLSVSAYTICVSFAFILSYYLSISEINVFILADIFFCYVQYFLSYHQYSFPLTNTKKKYSFIIFNSTVSPINPTQLFFLHYWTFLTVNKQSKVRSPNTNTTSEGYYWRFTRLYSFDDKKKILHKTSSKATKSFFRLVLTHASHAALRRRPLMHETPSSYSPSNTFPTHHRHTSFH